MKSLDHHPADSPRLSSRLCRELCILLLCRRADPRIDSRDARCLSGERPQLRTLPRHRPPEAEMIERGWEKKLEPLTVRVATAVRITGLSRSRIYELIQSGDLETVKVGRATLIQYQSLKVLTQNRSEEHTSELQSLMRI